MSKRLSANLITSFVIQGLNIATGILLSRSLGPTDRGVLVAILLIPTMIAGLSTFGIPSSATVWSARESRPTGALLGSSLLIAAGLSLIGLLFAFSILYLSNYFGWHNFPTMSYIYTLFIPLNLLTIVTANLLNGWARVPMFNMVRLSVVVINAGILLAFYFTASLTIEAAVASSLISNVVAALLSVSFALITARERLTVDSALAGDLLHFGIKAYPGSVAQIANERGDQLIIALLLPAQQLGYYVVSVTISSAPVLIASAIGLAALPLASAAHAGSEQRRIARTYTILVLMSGLAVNLPIFLFSTRIIGFFFGEAFEPATQATKILCIAGVVLGVNIVLRSVLIGTGQPGASSQAELIALALTIIGLLITVKSLGITGAALVSLIAYLVAGEFMYSRLQRTIKESSSPAIHIAN